MLRIKPHQVTVAVIFLLIVGGYLVMAMRFPIAYIWATYEDSFGEWGQFYFFATAFILSVWLAAVRSSHRLFFAILAIACFYVTMEEISWGQRVFGIRSSDFFKKYNLQGETNLHNMLVGPVSTGLRSAIEYGVAAALAAYGLLFPILLRLRWSVAVWFDEHGIASPPFYLSPFFVLAAYLELGPVSFNEAEVAEVLVSFALAALALHYLFFHRLSIHPSGDGLWGSYASDRLALRICGVATVVVVLSVGTTLLIYSSNEGRERITNRIENGLEKFAGRYARYGQWQVAADLYERIRAKKPRSTANLRKLANAHRELGDMETYELHVNRALEIDMRRLEKEPWRASTRRSLARTHELMGNDAEARVRLDQALEIGLKRISEHPDSANAAYSLGRTYEQMESDAESLEQFERALELKPTSKRFRKAYLRVKSNL